MNSKKILTGLLLVCFLFGYDLSIAQEKESYAMYTTVQIKVIKGMEKEFEKAVLAHNKQFHPEGTHQAFLRAIITGPKAGSYTWITGPRTFSDFDSAPGEGAHDDDWSTNVDPHVKHYGTIEHWKRNKDLTFIAPDSTPTKLSQVWFIDVTDGMWEQFFGNLGKAIAVSKKAGDESVYTYGSSFSGGDGRDVAMVFGIESWASLDEEDDFSKRFEEMHGEGSWKEFLDNWVGSTDGVVQVVTKLVE